MQITDWLELKRIWRKSSVGLLMAMEVDSLSEEAVGLEAFAKMSHMVQGGRKPLDLGPGTPFCARNLTEYPCILCGHLNVHLEDALEHANHEHGHADPHAAPMCPLCGDGFPSPGALWLHLIAEKVQDSCPDCHQDLDSPEDEAIHMCAQVSKYPPDETKVFFCPIGCPRRRSFDQDGILRHLITLHGCDLTDITFDMEVSSLNLKLIAYVSCPICRITVNDKNHHLDFHLMFHCNGRGELQKELIKSITDFSKEVDLNPDMLIRLEMESYLQDWLANLAQSEKNTNPDARRLLTDQTKVYLSNSIRRDAKYECLPPQFYKSLFSKVPEALQLEDLITKNTQRDFAFLMQLWNLQIQRSYRNESRLIQVSAELYRELRLKNMKGKRWRAFQANQKEPDTIEKPSLEVLKALEEELGFSLVDKTDASIQALSSALPILDESSPDPRPKKAKLDIQHHH